jgi:hypothetical protein
MIFAVCCLVCAVMPLFVQGESEQDSKLRYEFLKKLICKVDKPKPMKQPGRFIVSPDCTRVAYVICENGKEFVVVDGKENKQYDRIGEMYPIFSPDSKRVAYIAHKEKNNLSLLMTKRVRATMASGKVHSSLALIVDIWLMWRRETMKFLLF